MRGQVETTRLPPERRKVVTKTKAQIGMDDNWVKDEDLEKLLEEREELKKSSSSFRKTDKDARAKIANYEEKMPFRCGRFIISSKSVTPRSVEFEITGGSRVNIKTADE